MRVQFDHMKNMLREAYATSGADQKDIETMLFVELEQDLRGNLFSCLAKVQEVVEELRESKDKMYTVEVNLPGVKLLNGNGRNAKLVGLGMANMAAEMAKKQGIAMVALHNAGYHHMLEPYARAIAAEGLVGIVSSNGGPQGVAPFGGRTDVLGTNPLSFAIPTNDEPVVFDGATAKYAYGSIAIAKRRGTKLPENAYLDADGEWTTDAHKAVAIIPFGEHKGYAINMLLDVMTGCLIRGKSGLQVAGEDDLGSIMIAIDPAAFGSAQDFKNATSQLVKDIQAVKPAEGFSDVRVPGFTGEAHKRRVLQTGEIEIEDAVWSAFVAAYKKLTSA
jgi:LDH2 family malate/lactate/ureidoglycolate dehydrogenase